MDTDTKETVTGKTPDRSTSERESVHRLHILIPLAVTILLLAPFLNRAFSMDDPLFLWLAEQLLEHPLDPYGFKANWFGTDMPMIAVMQNPPLNSYFIALIARFAGFNEIILHTAYLLPAVAATAGTYLIACRFCRRPVEAALAAIFTPAFVVCGTTVMCDMMMLAFWVWSIFLWIRGMDERRPWMLALSGLLIAVTALTKYYGMALIPLLTVYTLMRERRPGWWLLSFLIPVAILAGYQFWTKSLYGIGLLSNALRVSGSIRSYMGTPLAMKTMIGMVFAGGCIGSVILHAPLLWRKWVLATAVGAAALLAVWFSGADYGQFEFLLEGLPKWVFTGQQGLFAVAGAGLLALAVTDLWSERDADSALLFLWLTGVLAFAAVFNWTVSGRALLPMAPVAGILIVRRIERRYSGAAPSLVAPLVLSGLLALSVAYADTHLVNSARTAVAKIRADYKGGGRIWYEGHWGFQYYMERAGGEHVRYKTMPLKEGDIVVIPANNSNVTPFDYRRHPNVVQFPGSPGLSTMSNIIGTGFHSDAWGPIPYAFGLTMPEYYGVMPVDATVLFIIEHSHRK